jgi:hypothetical protein
MGELNDLWDRAETALAEARAMPWGPGRIEALKNAGMLRLRAMEKQLALDRQRPPNPRVRQDWTFLQDPADGSKSSET